LKLLLQDPQGLFDVVFTNEDFQSWLLSVWSVAVPVIARAAAMRCFRPNSPKSRATERGRISGQARIRAALPGQSGEQKLS
jgi:hypothetical protein